MNAPLIVVTMGVSGCGKSTVGAGLARAWGVPFVEGDDLHSPANVARMAAGLALTDEDRREWLQSLAARIAQARRAGQGLVVSCSALKRIYRDVLRAAVPDLVFVHLRGDRGLLQARMAARPGHYMPVALLDSQFAILEPPGVDERALDYEVTLAPDAIVDAVRARLGAHQVTPPAASSSRTA
jgi:gluconokinase